ncbi:mesenteric estrogen-dependent adipogenesis protein [Gouania willdenowi]|uniref:Uncharacterized protein n=1 Tax=Gouania willdenowi TaxID=441366 RepID=A0A8C5G2X6_GOUWI|nr:mesenteric estrogen-dependent adipogenesis protein [Gouania willdenowi]
MLINNTSSYPLLTVTEVGEFLRNPPAGFTVETLLHTGYRVHSTAEDSLVLIDDFQTCTGDWVDFQQSMGRAVKMHNLWEYTSMRRSLLSKRIYLLMSACEQNVSVNNNNKKKKDTEVTVLKQFIVSLNGNNPLIQWQMEKGLDWTISSVAGESYKVDIDLTDALENWAELNNITEDFSGVKIVWRDASFTLKYYSDALFDFPHWFGFSKRNFKVRLT